MLIIWLVGTVKLKMPVIMHTDQVLIEHCNVMLLSLQQMMLCNTRHQLPLRYKLALSKKVRYIQAMLSKTST